MRAAFSSHYQITSSYRSHVSVTVGKVQRLYVLSWHHVCVRFHENLLLGLERNAQIYGHGHFDVINLCFLISTDTFLSSGDVMRKSPNGSPLCQLNPSPILFQEQDRNHIYLFEDTYVCIKVGKVYVVYFRTEVIVSKVKLSP
jgi:hypothetical protein